MVKTPTIIQFESDPFYQINLDLILNGIGQRVAAKATNVKEQQSQFDRIARRQIVPDIAIVGNYFSRSWNDGAYLAKRLKDLNPNVKLLCYSIIREEQIPEWADAYAVKSGLDNQHTILKALSGLLNIEITKTESELEDAY